MRSRDSEDVNDFGIVERKFTSIVDVLAGFLVGQLMHFRDIVCMACCRCKKIARV